MFSESPDGASAALVSRSELDIRSEANAKVRQVFVFMIGMKAESRQLEIRRDIRRGIQTATPGIAVTAENTARQSRNRG